MEQYESQIRHTFKNKQSGYDLPTGQTESDYDILVGYITEHKPKCIVEYGSGFSTRVIQKTINDLGLDTKFFSFEDNKYYYDTIKEHIELTDVVKLVPFERQDDKLGRYYHSYDGMEDVDFVMIDGPDTGRYNIRATTNVVDLHERFPNNKINVFIQGRISTTEYYIEKYGDKFKKMDKNGWGVL